MPYDSINLNALVKEGARYLIGAKVEKLLSPADDIVVLALVKGGEKRRLMISVNANSPAFFLFDQRFDDTKHSSPFLTSLRKSLSGGIIKAVDCEELERVVFLTFSSRDDFGYERERTLIAEIMGRYSNLFLLDESKRIIAICKSSPPDLGTKRVNITGVSYVPVAAQDKTDIRSWQEVSRLIEGNEGEDERDVLAKNLKGISIDLLDELIHRAKESAKEGDFAKKLSEQYQLLKENIKPTLFGQSLDFSLTPYLKREGILLDSLNAAAAHCYFERKGREKFSTLKRKLLAPKLATLKKTKKAIEEAKRLVENSKEFELSKQRGDLVLSFAYKLKGGEDHIMVENFYDDNRVIRIELDTTLSAQSNAQRFYKRYTKLKRQHMLSLEQLEKLTVNANALANEIERIEAMTSLEELEGAEPQKKSAAKKQRTVSLPYQYEVEGFVILAGKNNVQNDKLTRESNGNDLWMHASGINGCHIVLRGNNPPQHIVLRAASLAAYHSKARASQNVAVDITQIKNVKRPQGAPKGKVIFTNQRTVFVDPKNF